MPWSPGPLGVPDVLIPGRYVAVPHLCGRPAADQPLVVQAALGWRVLGAPVSGAPVSRAPVSGAPVRVPPSFGPPSFGPPVLRPPVFRPLVLGSHTAVAVPGRGATAAPVLG